MMACRTGPVGRAQVERVLAAMGWCPDHPDDSPYLHTRRADTIARLPEPVRAELAAHDPVLITTFPNVWGLASFERREVLVLCLFSDDLETVKQQCAHVAVAFPRTFEQVLEGRHCVFDPHVEVRRYDGNGLVARGVISDTGHVRFRRYVWSVRRRERVVLLALTGLSVLSTAAALLLSVAFPDGDGTYFRGYLDRLSSAVLTAAVVMVVNLIFEYRTWRNAKAVIDWQPAEIANLPPE
jgi:hypothetical protein